MIALKNATSIMFLLHVLVFISVILAFIVFRIRLKLKWYRSFCSSAIRVNACHKEGQSCVLTDERSSSLTLSGLRHRTFSARKLAGV